jgi:hypothetical protein
MTQREYAFFGNQKIENRLSKTLTILFLAVFLLQIAVIAHKLFPLENAMAADTASITYSSEDTFTSASASTNKSSATSTAWYNSSWHNRRALTIKGSSAGAQTNYQIKVTVSYGSKMKSDFSDVRFTNSNGTTLLNYWIESYNSGKSAVFYVNIPSIPAAPSTTKIYMYYGNSSAKDASSGASTFSLYDGFNTQFGTSALTSAANFQTLPTYDGSGQAVHPDVLYFANGWHGYKYWMAATPYPNENDAYENPSIMASNDGIKWIVPAGVTNPLAVRPACGHNNDPSLVYNSAKDEIWIYYLDTRRAVECSGFEDQAYYNHNYLNVIKSSDGVHWDTATTVIDWNLNDYPLYVSPSISMANGIFNLWMTDGWYDIYRYQSSDGLSWGEPERTNTWYKTWHINVKYIPEKSEYWMLSNFPYDQGMLKFSTSTDGINWKTFPNAALISNPGKWDANLYRSTFVYDSAANQIKVWYSAYTSDHTWHIGYTNKSYPTFLSALSKTGGWNVEQGSGTWASSNAQIKRGAYSGRLNQLNGDDGEQMIVSSPAPFSSNYYQEWDMYDDLASDTFKVVRMRGDGTIGLGVYSGSSDVYYSYHDIDYSYTVSSVKRTLGWHKFSILLKSDSSAVFFIDGVKVGTLTSQFSNAATISIEGTFNNPSSYYIDDMRIRKYIDSEPTVSVFGSEESK